MASNGNRKGKRGERDFCKHLRKQGYEARRSQQYQGVAVEGAGDVQTSVEGVRFEVKRYKDLPRLWNKQMQDWIQQAIEETPVGQVAVVAARGNREPWRYFYREWESGENVMVLATEVATANLYTHGVAGKADAA